jgi:hypothetical protein
MDATNFSFRTAAGIAFFNGSATAVEMANAAGPAMLNEAASGTNPTLVPNRADPDTGIGWNSSNNFSLIAGSTKVASISSNQIQVVDGSEGAPTIAFLADGDTGIYRHTTNVIGFCAGGSRVASIGASGFSATNSTGGMILNEAASGTNPTLVPNRADFDTGIGWVSADIGALVAGGNSTLQWNSSGKVGIGATPGTPMLNIQSGSLGTAMQLSDGVNYGLNINGVSGGCAFVMNGTQVLHLGNATDGNLLTLNSTTGSTGGTGSAGAGNQYVELNINGNRYKLLHDGTI